MTGTPRIRSQINVTLNGLIRNGTIAAFRTNLFGSEPPDEVVVTVTAPEADELDITWQKVSQALEPLPVDILVRVDLP